MVAEPRAKFEIIMKVVTGLLLPAAIFYLGHTFTHQQQQLEHANSLIPQLGSENARVREMATGVATYLAEHNELPGELVPVLLGIAKSDPSPQVALGASAALVPLENRNSELARRIEQDFAAFPSRIYIHITSESQRAAAKSLRTRLLEVLGGGFTVPGIERRQGPRHNELRFFKKSDRGDARRIAEALKALGVEVSLHDLTPEYESARQVRPGTFEIWLGKGFRAHS